jgi:polar amino acid transport system substrate-binding protein
MILNPDLFPPPGAGENRRRKADMRKKALSALLLVCAVCFSLFGCSGKSQSSSAVNDKSWDRARAAGKLIVGVEQNFPPMSFYDEKKQLSGYDIDIAAEAVKKLGIEAEFQPLSPAEIPNALEEGKIDCIWNYYSGASQDKTSENLTFSYMKSRQVVLCLAGTALQNLADLKGQRVGVKAGSGGQKAVEASTAFKKCLASIIEYKDYSEAKSSLDKQKISGIVMDEATARYYLEKYSDVYRILGKDGSEDAEVLETGDYCVAFRAENGSLARNVEDSLNGLNEDGTLSKFSKKWFGSDLSDMESSGESF